MLLAPGEQSELALRSFFRRSVKFLSGKLFSDCLGLYVNQWSSEDQSQNGGE
jgi:hypothetical protein